MKQWVTMRSPVKTNTVSFKVWKTATLSVTEIDTLLKINGCNQIGENP